MSYVSLRYEKHKKFDIKSPRTLSIKQGSQNEKPWAICKGQSHWCHVNLGGHTLFNVVMLNVLAPLFRDI